MTSAGIVNRIYEKSKLNSLTEDQFKCLIFIAGFTFESHSEMLTRLLPKLEHDKDITIPALTTECNDLLSIKRYTVLVQKTNSPSLTGNIQAKKKRSLNQLVGFVVTSITHVFVCLRKFLRLKLKKKNACPIHKKLVNKRNRKPTQINSVFATFKANYKGNGKYIVTVNNKPVRFQFDTALDIKEISQSFSKLLGKRLRRINSSNCCVNL